MNSTPPVRPASALVDGMARWRGQVADVLVRSRTGVDAPADRPERALDRTTYDDIVLHALYTSADALPPPPRPGQAPYTRGNRPASGAPGWDIRARHVLGTDPFETNRAVLTDLEKGATSLWLVWPEGPLPADTLAQVLSGVHLDLAPVALSPGARFTQVAHEFFALVQAQPETDPALVEVCLGADPLSLVLREGSAPAAAVAGLDAAVALAEQAITRPGRWTTFVADGTAAHEAGAGDAEELAITLAAAVTYLRAQLAAGIELAEALGQIEFRHCLSDDQFQGIAKLRAARLLWSRVTEVAGAGATAPGARQHAVTSAAMLSQRDPWVNVLRCTLATFAAATGGAHAITVLPIDAAIPGGAPGISPDLAARLARNTQLVLREESHLGWVLDPAGGSWYVESLTDALAQAAWDWFTRIEAAGGYADALPMITSRLAQTRRRRLADVAHRRRPLTGLSEFPDLAEAPLPAAARGSGNTATSIRYGAAFEALRDRSDAHLEVTGNRPQAALCVLTGGSARATFAANLLAAGGIQATRCGPYATAADVPTAELCAQSPIVVLCGSDKAYTADAAATVAALHAAGAAQVAITGAWTRPADDGAERPDLVLSQDIDAVEVLSGLLDGLGVR